jgi:hypothetical protein
MITAEILPESVQRNDASLCSVQRAAMQMIVYISLRYAKTKQLKIPVSAVRFRPWPPSNSKAYLP